MPEADRFVFYDNKKALPGLRVRFPSAEFCYVKDLPETASLEAAGVGEAVFALENEKLQKATALCRTLPLRVFVIPGGIGTQDEPIPVDVSKPRLDYMETEIVTVCNLNCRGCADYINLVCDEERYYALDRFRADLARMKTLFWGIGKIRLMGGEPLLNPELAAYAEAARGIFPDCDLRIVTNGLLLPSVPSETLARIKEARCSFDISNYPPTRKKRKEIVSALEKAGVGYNFSVPMRFFFKNLLKTPADDPAPAFRNCIFTHCHMMGNGRLAPCSYAYCIGRFNKRFGTDYPENDCVDLYAEGALGWEIVERFSNPHEFCRCCGSGVEPFLWQGHRRSCDARADDWQISDSFIGRSLAPKLQRLLKNGAAALRSVLQKKK